MTVNRKTRILYLLMFFLPALMFLVWAVIMRLTGAKIRLVPSVADEMFWYHQVGAMVRSHYPLGYYGYDGHHAVLGTFGPWGVVILLPYALFGRIFGWHLYSMCIANLVFLGIALVLFCMMSEPDRKGLLWTAVGYCLLLINVRYSITNMSEPLRWSLAIILSGAMVRIWRRRCGKIFIWVIMPLLLIYSTESYLLLGVFLPVFLLSVLPVRNFIGRGVLSAVISAPVLYVLNRILRLFTSGYSKYAGISRIEGIRKDTQIVFSHLNPVSLWRMWSGSHSYIPMYLLLFDVLAVSLIIKTAAGLMRQFGKNSSAMTFHTGENDIHLSGAALWDRNEDLMRCVGLTILLLGMIGGYCVFYEGPSTWTIVRGFHTFVVCAVLILAPHTSKRVIAAAVVLTLATCPSFARGYAVTLNRRYLSEKQLALMEKTKPEFDEIFDISKDHAPWENTIAHYGSRGSGTPTALTLALPDNAGYNVMFHEDQICEAKYAVVYNSFGSKEKYAAVIGFLKENGYRKAWSYKKKMTVLVRDEDSGG